MIIDDIARTPTTGALSFTLDSGHTLRAVVGAARQKIGGGADGGGTKLEPARLNQAGGHRRGRHVDDGCAHPVCPKQQRLRLRKRGASRRARVLRLPVQANYRPSPAHSVRRVRIRGLWPSAARIIRVASLPVCTLRVADYRPLECPGSSKQTCYCGHLFRNGRSGQYPHGVGEKLTLPGNARGPATIYPSVGHLKRRAGC